MPRYVTPQSVMLSVALVAALLLLSSAGPASVTEVDVPPDHRADVTPAFVSTTRAPKDAPAVSVTDGDSTRAATRRQRPTAAATTRRGPLVESRFSGYASRKALPIKLMRLCPDYCNVTQESLPDGVTSLSWRPSFCNAAVARRAVVHSFSPDQHFDDAAEAPTKLTVIFSAIGARYYGKGGQEYVWEAVRQWRVFHDESASDVRVVVNDDAAVDPRVVANATRFKVKLEPRSAVEPHVPEWKRYDRNFYIQGYMHPGGSRKTGNKDFNRLVSARFLALLGLMRRDNLTDVVHLENDMMVYADFRPIVRAFRRCGNEMATLFPSKKGAIPGVLLVRDAEPLGRLMNFINDLLSCKEPFGRKVTDREKDYANDMTYLMNYYQLNGAHALGDLPNHEYLPHENCLADELPNVMFDGASFGQWYSFAIATAGIGKTNRASAMADRAVAGRQTAGNIPQSVGFTTLDVDDEAMSAYVRESIGGPVSTERPPENIRNAMRERYIDITPGLLMQWVADAAGRRVPTYKGYAIAALHVHAKNLFWFRSA